MSWLTSTIVRQYNDLNFKRAHRERAHAGSLDAPAPVASIQSARFETDAGEPVVSLQRGEPCKVVMEVRFAADTEDPVFTLWLRNEFGVIAFAARSDLLHGQSGSFHVGEVATIKLRFDNWLAPARYDLAANVTSDGPAAEIYDSRYDLGSLIVYATETGGGVVDLPHTLDVERGP
jgi:hypothetical protein